MATIVNIRGMLLEEVLLKLLEMSGYRTITDAPSDDETLRDGHSGMEVFGRGSVHQIDAIADYSIAHPFSHPQRLLVEAKCYTSQSVGIEIARNCVGVLKDVSGFWVSRGGIPKKRCHYQYALFSASGYTEVAQRYAFAHDIYLIPVQQSRVLSPLVTAIKDLSHEDFGVTSWNSNIQVDMKELRRAIRKILRDSIPFIEIHTTLPDILERLDTRTDALERLSHICNLCNQRSGALLAMIMNQFPVFLVPSKDNIIRSLQQQREPIYVQIG